MPTPTKPRPVTLRVELQHVEPLVWRRVIVSNQATLAALHNYLQWIMGWNDTHAHEFQVGNDLVAPAWWIEEMRTAPEDYRGRDERRVSVAAVVAQLGSRGEFVYRYDMGDDWALRIVIEPGAAAVIEDLPLPRCVAGENAGPPDDVGGPPGFAMFLEALRDPAHEEHVEMVRWVGGVFDPKGFDLNRLNREWKRGSGRRR